MFRICVGRKKSTPTASLWKASKWRASTAPAPSSAGLSVASPRRPSTVSRSSNMIHPRLSKPRWINCTFFYYFYAQNMFFYCVCSKYTIKKTTLNCFSRNTNTIHTRLSKPRWVDFGFFFYFFMLKICFE